MCLRYRMLAVILSLLIIFHLIEVTMRLEDNVFQLINGDFSTPQEVGNLKDEDEEHEGEGDEEDVNDDEKEDREDGSEEEEDDDETFVGQCHVCQGHGTVGTECSNCEDSGMIYDHADDEDDKAESDEDDHEDVSSGSD
jgi:hypothetical protein